MTVAALPASVTYAENGVTTSFAVPFRFKAAGDLIVSRIAAGVETVLALGTDYTVTGGDTDAGGTLTRLVATNGASLKITRSTARVQPMQYTNGGCVPGEKSRGSARPADADRSGTGRSANRCEQPGTDVAAGRKRARSAARQPAARWREDPCAQPGHWRDRGAADRHRLSGAAR